jgi:hypothetical protein
MNAAASRQRGSPRPSESARCFASGLTFLKYMRTSGHGVLDGRLGVT